MDNASSVETIVLLSHKSSDSHINAKVEFGEGDGKVPLDVIAELAWKYQPKQKVTADILVVKKLAVSHFFNRNFEDFR